MTLFWPCLAVWLLTAVLVVAALAMSSRLSRREGLEERYEREVDARERRAPL